MRRSSVARSIVGRRAFFEAGAEGCGGFWWNASDVNRPPNTEGVDNRSRSMKAELIVLAHDALLAPEACDRLTQAAAVAKLVKLR
jgi:hypothetical protein